MPRLSNDAYLLRRTWLVNLLESSDRTWFVRLSPNEQWDLHGFFAPTKDFTDQQALEHRAAASIRDRSLPHRAGKAQRRLFNLMQGTEPEEPVIDIEPTPPPRRGRPRASDHLRVYGQVRPEIDMKRLADTLILLAKWQQDHPEGRPESKYRKPRP